MVSFYAVDRNQIKLHTDSALLKVIIIGIITHKHQGEAQMLRAIDSTLEFKS